MVDARGCPWSKSKVDEQTRASIGPWGDLDFYTGRASPTFGTNSLNHHINIQVKYGANRRINCLTYTYVMVFKEFIITEFPYLGYPVFV